MGLEPAAAAIRSSVREPRAFGAFYSQHAERLFAYLARRVHNADLAFDLTAETFAQAYVGRAGFRGSTDAEAAAWLFGIARRQLALYFRKGAIERRALERLGIEVPDLDEAQRTRLEELADLDGLRVALRAELERLSDAQRQAVHLRVVEELPYAEVARRLEISEGAARVRVARALKALATALDSNPLVGEVVQ